jgi:chlorobactene glucosyltransferase
MFSGFREARRGLSKNIFDFLGRISALLFFAFFAVLIFLVLPVYLGVFEFFRILCAGDLSMLCAPFRLCLLVNVLFIFLTWVFLFISQGLPWFYAFLYPIMFVNLLNIALLSWYRSGRAGYIWKGRKVL